WHAPQPLQGLAQARAAAMEDFQHLQGTDDAVTGATAIQAQQVAGRLAAQYAAMLVELLVDVAIPDLRPDEVDAAIGESPLQPEVGHHRADHRSLQPPALLPVAREHVEEVVAVAHLALVIDEHDPVTVAIESDAEVGAGVAQPPCQSLRMGRTDSLVDVEAVGLDTARVD